MPLASRRLRGQRHLRGQQPRCGRGFSLLELIIALAMVAIMAVSLYTSMKIAFSAKQAADEAVEPSRTAELVMEFIRNDFQNAMPPHDPSTYKSPYQYLAGPFQGSLNGSTTDGDVLFYSTADMRDHVTANGEIKEIELTVGVPAGSAQRCLIRKASRNLLTEIVTPPDEEILCRNVKSFSLRYYDGTTWIDQWDSTQLDNTLPAAVEVTLVLDRSTPQQEKVLTFTRIFALPCSTTTSTTDSTTTGTPQ